MRNVRLFAALSALAVGWLGCPDNHPPAGDADGDGFTADEGDCDDHDAATFPGAEEICDGRDNDCNGIDDDPFDLDGDGISAPCEGDCDDSDPEVYPNAEEVCDGIDNDCSGRADDAEGIDEDQDGVCVENGDCDDEDPTSYPGATEYCNGTDNDCDGIIDNGYDADGDGWSACGGDCDDDEPATNPDATETCDGRDNDCDGEIDEDFDGDGDGWADCSGDCDDTDPDVNPDMPELCNGIDDNCNGQVDEEVDEDEDGYTPCGGDCDDHDPSLHPGALDGPDGVDNDCDGNVDEFYGWNLDVGVMTVILDGSATAHFGYGLAGFRDVTGDGIDDLLVGSPFEDGAISDSGTADCVAGEAADWFTNPPLLDVAHAVDGTVTDAQVGFAVALGDLDGDGAGDLVIAGPYREYTLVPDGDVYLFFGGAGAIPASPDTGDADVIIRGAFGGEHAGYGLAADGDVDGDGVDDLLIGAPYNNATGGGGVEGGVYLVTGRASWSGVSGTDDADAFFMAAGDDELLGAAVALVPDLDGDGCDEILIGSEDGDSGAGRAYLLYGHGGGWSDVDLADADAVFYTSGSDGWGIAVGGLRDLDNDGRGEMWIGSASYGGGGAVALYRGSATRFSGNVALTASADVIFEGASGDEAYLAAGTGDLDADGDRDIAIGAPGNGTNGTQAGAVYIVEGPASSWGATVDLASVSIRLVGESAGDRLGSQVVRAGDLNDDGFQDLAIAAPYNDDNGSQAGKVYVVFGY